MKKMYKNHKAIIIIYVHKTEMHAENGLEYITVIINT